MRSFPNLHVDQVRGSYQVPFHALDDKNRLVALIQGDQLRPKELSIGEARAYARLFAASPKLLAAAIATLKGADQSALREAVEDAIGPID